MDLHYKQEISVGLLVIAAIALFAVGVALLSGRTIGPSSGVEVPVQFSDVIGLRAGDPVQISGVKVGKVERVVLQDVGQVMVYLSVNTDVRPHADARAAVSSLDLFGTKFINYEPGRSPDMLKQGTIITGARETALTEGVPGLTARATEALTAAQGILSDRTADEIHATMIAATRALDVITKVGSGPGVTEATATLKAVQSLAAHLDSIIANPSIKKSADQLDELTTNLNEMTSALASTTRTLSSMMHKMDSGQGSFGKIMNDTALYTEMLETLKSLHATLDDLRAHPDRYIRVKVF
ncbi:MAG: MCE family protein [Gemmatimonadetes bacterium]|nr:MCE family protein [Gemmatimonadota bacterium]